MSRAGQQDRYEDEEADLYYLCKNVTVFFLTRRRGQLSLSFFFFSESLPSFSLRRKAVFFFSLVKTFSQVEFGVSFVAGT